MLLAASELRTRWAAGAVSRGVSPPSEPAGPLGASGGRAGGAAAWGGGGGALVAGKVAEVLRAGAKVPGGRERGPYIYFYWDVPSYTGLCSQKGREREARDDRLRALGPGSCRVRMLPLPLLHYSQAWS